MLTIDILVSKKQCHDGMFAMFTRFLSQNVDFIKIIVNLLTYSFVIFFQITDPSRLSNDRDKI